MYKYLNYLIQLANHLDKINLHKEADVIDNFLKLAQTDKEKEQYFVDRTNRHIALVKDAIEKIATANPEFYHDFWANELIARGKIHDVSKFEEPEKTPYIELTWNKKLGVKDDNPAVREATLHHILNNSHHPEYHNKEQANISKEDRDKSDRVIDASKMPPLDIAEMVADWQAMSEELGTNTAREWYDKQKDVRWKFSSEQDKLIDRLLKVFEK